jgi:putative FmdB family regulatory protein
MPTYDYQCTACKHRFEQFQSMKDKPLRKCPACGKPALERLIGTGAAVIFKGSGFYQTDYRSEGYKKAAEADAKPASDAGKSVAPAPDAKPSADAPAKPTTPEPKPAPGRAESPSRAPSKPSSGKPKSKK